MGVTLHYDQLNSAFYPSGEGKSSTRLSAWGAFTCVGWQQVTPCGPIWQVRPCSLELIIWWHALVMINKLLYAGVGDCEIQYNTSHPGQLSLLSLRVGKLSTSLHVRG